MRSEFEWDSAMANAAKRGDEACLKSLVEHFSEVWPDRDFLGARGISAMREACIHGRKLCLEILLHAMGPSVQLEFALRLAACNGHHECVAMLIPRCDCRVDDSEALKLAASYGNARCVELLIPVSDPKSHGSFALLRAASEGSLACVALLLPVSHPLAENPEPAIAAMGCGHAKVFAALLSAEPALADEIDFEDAFCAAQEVGHVAMASLLRVLIEKSDISSCVQSVDLDERPPPRL